MCIIPTHKTARTRVLKGQFSRPPTVARPGQPTGFVRGATSWRLISCTSGTGWSRGIPGLPLRLTGNGGQVAVDPSAAGPATLQVWPNPAKEKIRVAYAGILQEAEWTDMRART